MFRRIHRRDRGFTIVELVVVISIIGILASIVYLRYGNYQTEALDTVRRNDLNQVSAALSAYAVQKSDYIETASGCGANGNGNGWLSAGPSDISAALYPKSVVTCLQDAQLLGAGSFVDPLKCTYDSGGICGSWNGSPVRAYMKATCKKGGTKITYLLSYITTIPRIDAEVDALCDANSVSGFTSDGQKWGTHYGMNYYVIVK